MEISLDIYLLYFSNLFFLRPGETPDSLEEKRVELVTIFNTERPSAWNWHTIKEKMNLTYALQRRDIHAQAENIAKHNREQTKKRRTKKNTGEENNPPRRQVQQEPVITTIQLQEKWPFLFTPNGMMSHYQELTKINFEEQVHTFLETEAKKVMKFLTEKNAGNRKIQRKLDKSLRRAARNNELDQESPTVAAFFAMLAKYFNEDLSFLIKVIEVQANFSEIFPLKKIIFSSSTFMLQCLITESN